MKRILKLFGYKPYMCTVCDAKRVFKSKNELRKVQIVNVESKRRRFNSNFEAKKAEKKAETAEKKAETAEKTEKDNLNFKRKFKSKNELRKHIKEFSCF